MAILYSVFRGARYLVNPSSSTFLDFLFVSFLPWYKWGGLILGGLLAGLIGSWLSLRENTDESVVAVRQ